MRLKETKKKGLYHEAESTCHIDHDKRVNHIHAIAFWWSGCTSLFAMQVAVFTTLNYTPQRSRRYEMITCSGKNAVSSLSSPYTLHST